MMEGSNNTNTSSLEQAGKIKLREQYELYWQEFEQIFPDDYLYNWQPEMRKGYMEQGVEFVVDIHEKKVDAIVFIDKSARPLALFFLALWKRIFPNENPPQMRFIIGEKGKQVYTQEVRDFFKEVKGDTDEQIDTKISDHENQRIEQIQQTYRKRDFENRFVLIIEEYGNEGGTLKTAQERFSRAFPEIKQLLVGALDWQYDSTYKTPLKLDIPPPSDSPDNPSYYSPRIKKLGNPLFHRTYDVIEPKLGDAKVIASRNPETKITETIINKLLYIGKFEQLDQQSIRSVDKAEQYCTKQNDKIGAERAQKIKRAFLSLC